jgi:hypothetical protein
MAWARARRDPEKVDEDLMTHESSHRMESNGGLDWHSLGKEGGVLQITQSSCLLKSGCKLYFIYFFEESSI